MDLVYFGSGAFGIPTLAALTAAHRVRLIVTQPDRPAGLGGVLTPTPVGAWAAEHLPGVLVLKPERVNAPEVVSEIRGAAGEAWVVIAFGQKLGRALLDGVLAVNLHASLLPRWRGAAPINAAILAGDAETGNSVITLADRMDAGEVLGQSRRSIDPMQTAGELHDALAADGPSLVQDVLASAAAGTLRRVVQDESRVTLAAKLSKDDAWVDLHRPAVECVRRVHGLTPWPGVTVQLRDTSGGPASDVKLLRVKAVETTSQQVPGTLIDAAAGLVACGGGTVLRLLEVQPAGKRPMKYEDFARGRRPGAGACLVGRNMGAA